MIDNITYNDIMRDDKSFYQKVISAIKTIPKGKVVSYGQVALVAGNPRAARQVSYILHSSSAKHNLPWHRVVNGKGSLSLKPGNGYELQKKLLEKEGVFFDDKGFISKKFFLYAPNVKK